MSGVTFTRGSAGDTHSMAVNSSDFGVFKYLSCFVHFSRKFLNSYIFLG